MSELPMTKDKPSVRAQLEGVATVTTRSPEKLTHYDADTERRDIVERLLQPMSSDPSEVQRERFLAAQEITRLRAQPSLRERDIDIVFDGPPGPEAGRFVEVEDGHGRSINVGEWVQRPDGLWALRLRAQPSPRDVALTAAEKQSGFGRLRFAEGLIEQLPENHDGRNTWLLNYGRGEEAVALRDRRGIGWDEHTQAALTSGGREGDQS